MASRRQMKAMREFATHAGRQFPDLRIGTRDSRKTRQRKTDKSILRRIELFEGSGLAKDFPELEGLTRQMRHELIARLGIEAFR